MTTTTTLRPWLTPAEAGQILGLSSWAVTRMCVKGEMPVLVHKKGAPWRIITARLREQFGLSEEQALKLAEAAS